MRLILIVLLAATSSSAFAKSFVCSDSGGAIKLQFSDQQIGIEPTMFTYSNQTFTFAVPVTAESFCENNHTGQWQCANDNPSPVSAITYSASQLTANKIAFAFELYWNMKGKLPQANYATVNPFFLNVKQTLVLKCAEEDSVD